MYGNIWNGTLDEDTTLPPGEPGVSSMKSCALVDDGDLSSPCLNEGDAHKGRAFMYNLAISTGEPPSSSVTCTNRISFQMPPSSNINIQYKHAKHCLSYFREN